MKLPPKPVVIFLALLDDQGSVPIVEENVEEHHEEGHHEAEGHAHSPVHSKIEASVSATHLIDKLTHMQHEISMKHHINVRFVPGDKLFTTSTKPSAHQDILRKITEAFFVEKKPASSTMPLEQYVKKVIIIYNAVISKDQFSSYMEVEGANPLIDVALSLQGLPMEVRMACWGFVLRYQCGCWCILWCVCITASIDIHIHTHI